MKERKKRAFEPWEIHNVGAVNLVLAIYKQPAREYVNLLRKIKKATSQDRVYSLEMQAAEIKRYFNSDPYCLLEWNGDTLCNMLRDAAMKDGKVNWMRGENGRWLKKE